MSSGLGFIWALGSAAWLGLLAFARLITDTAQGERSVLDHSSHLSHQAVCCWGLEVCRRIGPCWVSGGYGRKAQEGQQLLKAANQC